MGVNSRNIIICGVDISDIGDTYKKELFEMTDEEFEEIDNYNEENEEKYG